MRALCLSLLLMASASFGWTYRTVEAPLDPTRVAFLRFVKKSGGEFWFLIIPGDAGHEIHPVASVRIGKGSVSLNSRLYGPLLLRIVHQRHQPSFHFIFNNPEWLGFCSRYLGEL